MNDLVDRDRELPDNKANDWDLDHICAHVPGSGELLIHRLHIFRANRHKGTHSKSGMTAYQGGVVTGGVGIVIILLCVTSIMSNIHRNNAT